MVSAMACSMATAWQSLDVPEQPTFGDNIPKKKKSGEAYELDFEIKGEIEIEKSSLVKCSESAASGENLEVAIADCNAAVEAAPDNGDAYYYRGVVLSHLGRIKQAELDFTSAISLNANRLAEAYYWRGVSKEAQRKLRDAASDFKKAAELKPEWSAARRKVDEYRWALE